MPLSLSKEYYGSTTVKAMLEVNRECREAVAVERSRIEGPLQLPSRPTKAELSYFPNLVRNCQTQGGQGYHDRVTPHGATRTFYLIGSVLEVLVVSLTGEVNSVHAADL